GDQFRIAYPAGLPQLRVHADIGKARQSVDFVNHHLVIRRQKHVDARHPTASQRLISFNGDRPDLVVNVRIERGGNHNLGTFIVNIFGVVGIEVTVQYHFTTGTRLREVVAQYGALNFTTVNSLLNHHLMVKLKGQTNGIVKLRFAGGFADADGRALIRRFHKQRQAELRLDLREAVFIAVGASERHERRNIQTGVAQETFCDVFIHAGGRAQHIGTDKWQVRHPQHALQRAVFAQRAVNDREH